MTFSIIVVAVLAVIPASAFSDAEIYQAAAVLKGEAPVDCPGCRLTTACAIARDMKYGVCIPCRWYGYRNPGDDDIRLIEDALYKPYTCRYKPICKYVGNERDMGYWARAGMIGDSDIDVECSRLGCTVCVVESWPAPRVVYQKHVYE